MNNYNSTFDIQNLSSESFVQDNVRQFIDRFTNRHVIKYKEILSDFNMHKWYYLQSLLSKHKIITLWYYNDKIVTLSLKINISSLHSSLSIRVSRTRSPVWEWKLLKCGTGTIEDGTQRLRVFAWHIQMNINLWCTLFMLLYSIHCIGTSSIYMINNLL